MKTLMKTSMGVMVAMLAFGAVSEVSAQGGIGLSFGKHGRRGGFGVSIGIPLGGGHCQPAPCAPAPCHVHHEGCKQHFPGRWETRCEQVWVPGACRQVWCDPVYRTDYDHCGRPYQVLVSSGCYQTVQDPGYYQSVQRQVWIEGTWQLVCGY